MAFDPPLLPRTARMLPNYAHPPLIAVRLGIRCPAEVTIDETAFGQQLGPTWWKCPNPTVAQPWTQIEPTDEHHQATFASVLGDLHLQVHSHGIDLLWDGRSGESYPHYETLRDTFLTAFDAWSQAAVAGPVSLNRWQISYANRIPRGTVWNRPSDLGFCRLLASATDTAFAEQLVDFRQTWTFRAATGRSLLRCDAWLDAHDAETTESVIWLVLTTSGPVQAASIKADDTGSDWLSELDAGRRWIVSGFQGLMSPSANAYWGLVAPSSP